MTDLLATVPKDQWPDFARSQRDGAEATWRLYGDRRPPIAPGDYLYLTARGRVRCALDVTVMTGFRGVWMVRGIFCAALTVDRVIEGFRGWKPAPFPRSVVHFDHNWTDFAAVPAAELARLPAARLAHGKTASEQGGSSV